MAKLYKWPQTPRACHITFFSVVVHNYVLVTTYIDLQDVYCRYEAQLLDYFQLGFAPPSLTFYYGVMCHHLEKVADQN